LRRLSLALAILVAFAVAFAPSASADGAWGSNGCGASESGGSGAIRIKSFDCVLVGGNRPILCKRGSHKVRGPLAG